MIRSKAFLCLLTLFIVSACDLNHKTFKLSGRTLRVPNEYVIHELLGMHDASGFDKNVPQAPLIFNIRKMSDNKIKKLLGEYILTEDFSFFVHRSVDFDLRFKKTSADELYFSSANQIPSTVKDGDFIYIVNSQGLTEAHCGWPIGMYKDKLCKNYVSDGELLIEYEVPLPFMLDPNRKKALDDFLMNQVREWTVKP